MQKPGLTKPRRAAYNTFKEVLIVNMMESARIMLGLRAKGWSDTEIVNFCIWVETGDEKYKPQEES